MRSSFATSDQYPVHSYKAKVKDSLRCRNCLQLRAAQNSL